MRILLAEGHPVAAYGVIVTLQAEADFEIVGLAHEADQARRLSISLRPDLLLLDPSLPGMGPLQLRTLMGAHADMKTLIFPHELNADAIARFRGVKLAGGVLKGEPVERLIEALRTVGGGGNYFTQALSARLGSNREIPLTPRELEVLELLCQGRANAEIARTLGLAQKTVRNLVSSIYLKLDFRSRAEAILWGVGTN